MTADKPAETVASLKLSAAQVQALQSYREQSHEGGASAATIRALRQKGLLVWSSSQRTWVLTELAQKACSGGEEARS